MKPTWRAALKAPDAHAVWLGLRIPKALDDRLEAVASREGNPKSAVIRRLLSAGLDREEETR